ncbi:Vacuolar fusion protein mon1 [Malassezia sp. CBS 17886]|nr:Vacuolar fusion protein mon1 [Malassezia sp. CBS 17886]
MHRHGAWARAGTPPRPAAVRGTSDAAEHMVPASATPSAARATAASPAVEVSAADAPTGGALRSLRAVLLPDGAPASDGTLGGSVSLLTTGDAEGGAASNTATPQGATTPTPVPAASSPPPPPPPPPTSYLVFSNAGKLVYASCGMEREAAYTQAGVMHALVSLFDGDVRGDALQQLELRQPDGTLQIAFLAKPPLHVACVAKHAAPTGVLGANLAQVHAAVVSLVSADRLERLFLRMPSFDLQALLEPTRTYLDGVVHDADTSLALVLGALPVCGLDAGLRTRLRQVCVPSGAADAAPRDLLYVIVLVRGQVACLAHPRHHVVHAPDVLLVLAMVRDGAANPHADDAAGDAWAPMCLPHFAPHGFVYVYAGTLGSAPDAPVLVLVGADRDGLVRARAWRDVLQPEFADGGGLAGVQASMHAHAVTTDDVGVPGLRDFVLTSRRHGQSTSVAHPDCTKDERAARLLLYQHTLAMLRGDRDAARLLKSCSHPARAPPVATPLRVYQSRTDAEALLGWRTDGFELCLALRPPWLSKGRMAAAANRVLHWVRARERERFAVVLPFG